MPQGSLLLQDTQNFSIKQPAHTNPWFACGEFLNETLNQITLKLFKYLYMLNYLELCQLHKFSSEKAINFRCGHIYRLNSPL